MAGAEHLGGTGMKLEDCTKDELIYLLNRRCWSYISSTSELEFDVLMYRSEETSKAMSCEAEKETEALAEYTELLKPYAGERLIDTPERIYLNDFNGKRACARTDWIIFTQ
jgi:hypothetical protein